ncbi:MAG: hypothetical protein K9I68_02470 [Bacteroidales bacterium]|nr:hypothetical protein [Bacteroidales bacterium]MCF8337178.1 hypothetical protein [Bacteroidales bacterium]
MNLKTLKNKAIEHNRANYPNVPDRAIPAPRYEDKTANGLTRCIIDYIKFSGGQAERISNTGRKISQKKTFTDVIGNKRVIGQDKWIRSNMTAGTADVSAIINGRSVKIEVKIGKDRQSPEQREYQKQVEAAGGLYIVAKSFEDFIKKLNVKQSPGDKTGAQNS